MTEKQLIALGFERVDVSAEESGATPFYYYIFEKMNLSIISTENDLVENDNWGVKIYDIEDVSFYDYKDFKSLLNIVCKTVSPN